MSTDGPSMANESAVRGRGMRLALLSVLYFAQGLPFGFQATALPVYLRASGVSVATIGFLGLLSAPWMLKVAWAPLVDRHGSRRFGRRKSWIVPLQAALAAASALAAFADPERQLGALLGLVFAMNLFAATQDIAVDGLAIDTLLPDELGPGNAAQVVGYKLGMLTGGGLLVWASARIGYRGAFLAMGGLSLAVLAIAALVPERSHTEPTRDVPTRDGAQDARLDLKRVLAIAAQAVRTPGGRWLIAVVATYKLGESLSDVLYKPFLVDAGLGVSEIGFWAGTWGVVASLAGSFAGGVVATRLPLPTALGVTAALRIVPLLGRVWLATSGIEIGRFAAVTLAEELCGGALTTVLFALMMSRVDRRIGATHYTLLASVEVAGKLPGGAIGGLLVGAGGWSYAHAFLLGAALSVAFLPLLTRLRVRPPA